jgi:hypothetical protein
MLEYKIFFLNKCQFYYNTQRKGKKGIVPVAGVPLNHSSISRRDVTIEGSAEHPLGKFYKKKYRKRGK